MSIRYSALRLVVRALAAGLGRLPPGPGRWLGRRLGDLAFVALPGRRRIARANLARAFPHLPPGERARLCRASFQSFGLTLMEICRAAVTPVETLLRDISVDGMEHLKAAMEGRGRALALSAHLGNWEFLSVAHLLTGYRLAVVARRLDSSVLDRVAEDLRRKAGVDLIDKRDALRPALAALRAGRFVGILLDQNATRREGVFVPFFGVPASTSRSIAVLALRTATPIVPIFIRRDGTRHRVTIHPPIDPPAANGGDEAVVELTMRCTRAIEEAIRAVPEQWLWIHNRWRTRPVVEERPR
ncbi:MAG: lysophospholipid acyltransferase family protein [Candidatus Rokuibacteriota bacterium]